jgi:hypothetical protein
MAITINKTTAIENDHRQWVFMTIPVLGENYKYVYTAPKDLSDDDLQSYIDGRENFYKEKVLRNLYPDADVYNSSLEDFEAWVSAGCKNAEVKGVDADGEEIVIKAEEVIEKKAWVDSEPPVDQASLIAELQAKITALENA